MNQTQNTPLKVLYVPRKWFKSWTMKSLEKSIYAFRHRKEFFGQDGFFEVALFSSCNVDSLQIEKVVNNVDFINNHYDLVVVNSKYHKRAMRLDDFNWMSALKLPAVLFCGKAMADRLPPDEVLDKFDLVYKRELFQDLSKYDNTDKNWEKLRTTMLSCPFVRAKRTDPIQLGESPGPRKSSTPYKYDVFFLGGIQTNMARKMIIERLEQEPFNFYGGLYNQKTNDNSNKKPLGLEEYQSIIQSSKINLALEGWGQFTFRHLEIWAAGAFCLSTPSIRGISLPFENPQEGIHYVAFDGLDDLVSKVKYYLEHDKEREAIANAGRELFKKIYNPIAHGREIRNEFQSLIKQD